MGDLNEYKAKLLFLNNYYSNVLYRLQKWIKELDKNREVISYLESKEDEVKDETVDLLVDYVEEQMGLVLQDMMNGFHPQDYPEWNGFRANQVQRQSLKQSLEELISLISSIQIIADSIADEEEEETFLLDVGDYFIRQLQYWELYE